MTIHLTPGARVVTPGGIQGTAERVSAGLTRWPILVKRDDGQSRSYAVSELTRLAPRNPMREPLP